MNPQSPEFRLPEDELKVLVSLDDTKSTGIDGVSPKALKFCATALCEPLCHLFNLSLSQHVLPKEWLIHSITPIHKSGDKSAANNHRLNSLLCVVSKVLEKIIYNKISAFVFDFLSSARFGFFPSHSTLQQLLIMFDSIHSALENKLQIDVIYLDFKRAFDSVPHNEFILKLAEMGITGSLWKWLRTYLNVKKQY